MNEEKEKRFLNPSSHGLLDFSVSIVSPIDIPSLTHTHTKMTFMKSNLYTTYWFANFEEKAFRVVHRTKIRKPATSTRNRFLIQKGNSKRREKKIKKWEKLPSSITNKCGEIIFVFVDVVS